MNFNILHIFVLVVVSITGVISDDDNGVIINGKNTTDIPTASTVINNNGSTPIPPPTTSTSPTPDTTINPNTTTTTIKPPTTTNATTTSSTPAPTPTTTTTSTTPASNVTSTTESTTSVPTSAPSHKGRRFDGPSFIGGIILASGLMAICFVSWKFYKARTERNYHTL